MTILMYVCVICCICKVFIFAFGVFNNNLYTYNSNLYTSSLWKATVLWKQQMILLFCTHVTSYASRIHRENKKCEEKEGLRSWEVNFGYVEHGERKNALVKISKLEIILTAFISIIARSVVICRASHFKCFSRC